MSSTGPIHGSVEVVVFQQLFSHNNNFLDVGCDEWGRVSVSDVINFRLETVMIPLLFLFQCG